MYTSPRYNRPVAISLYLSLSYTKRFQGALGHHIQFFHFHHIGNQAYVKKFWSQTVDWCRGKYTLVGGSIFSNYRKCGN
jgi:hypothetical protein